MFTDSTQYIVHVYHIRGNYTRHTISRGPETQDTECYRGEIMEDIMTVQFN